MPHDLGATYVMVNIPDYTLKVVQNGKTVWSTKIVVGKPGEQATPLLTETMKYITVNPTWNVPPSIIRNEYLPALARDPDALSRIGLQMGRNKDGSIRIFQPPGERNALGRIRFNFPNRFLVYQHDTPDKNLFAHDGARLQPRLHAGAEPGSIRRGAARGVAAGGRIHRRARSARCTAQASAPSPSSARSRSTSPIRPRSSDDAGKPQARADIYGLDRDILRELHGDRRNSDVPIARNYNSSSKPVRSAGNAQHRRGKQSARQGFWLPEQPEQPELYDLGLSTMGSSPSEALLSRRTDTGCGSARTLVEMQRPPSPGRRPFRHVGALQGGC